MTREEAIKLIDDRMCFGRGKWSEHHMPEIDDYWKAGQIAIKALEQPELKKGEWQTHYDVLARTVEVRCSFCHAKSNIDPDLLMDDGTKVELFKYCPCCGAKMDGEKNE